MNSKRSQELFENSLYLNASAVDKLNCGTFGYAFLPSARNVGITMSKRVTHQLPLLPFRDSTLRRTIRVSSARRLGQNRYGELTQGEALFHRSTPRTRERRKEHRYQRTRGGARCGLPLHVIKLAGPSSSTAKADETGNSRHDLARNKH